MDKKEELLAKRADAQKKLSQLENRQKILLNKQRDAERRARTHRLIERGAILEGVFPAIANTDDEEVKAFLIALSRLPVSAELLEKVRKSKERE